MPFLEPAQVERRRQWLCFHLRTLPGGSNSCCICCAVCYGVSAWHPTGTTPGIAQADPSSHQGNVQVSLLLLWRVEIAKGFWKRICKLHMSTVLMVLFSVPSIRNTFLLAFDICLVGLSW